MREGAFQDSVGRREHGYAHGRAKEKYLSPFLHIHGIGGENMPYEEIKKVQQRPHSLNLEGREKMSITGVDDVSGFDENTIVLTTSQGDLNIHGQGLHIDRIDLDAGELELRGKIQELSYDEPARSGSLWSRLFG